jgi:uncharacterized protein (TIGR03083 family)
MADAWSMIHAERRSLADDLSGLTEEQWARPSLCTGWSVRDVLAHMTATAKMTPAKFFPALAGSGFNFGTFTDKVKAKELGSSGQATLENFKGVLNATTHPPGPTLAMVGEAVVHSADIRQPLGIDHQSSAEAMTAAADFYKRSNLLIGAKRRMTGLRFAATDVDWSSGSGPEVSGPMISIVLAMCGRPAAVDDLTGDGLATLRTRL